MNFHKKLIHERSGSLEIRNDEFLISNSFMSEAGVKPEKKMMNFRCRA
jgi:hypothetical protein